MEQDAPYSGHEFSAESATMAVNTTGFGGVEVSTPAGFVFRFARMGDGCAFVDGYLPSEDPDATTPDRGWVFETYEVPAAVVEALTDAGYDYTGESATPRARFIDESAGCTWQERAARYAVV